jgi:ankyrin repeat protein
MTLRPLYGFFPGLLILGLLYSCRGGSSGEDQQKQQEVQEESWHMSDEIPAVQVSAEEEEAFRMAAHDGNLEKVRDLHGQGVICDAVDQEGHTALMYAAFNGHSEIVLYLLDGGADINRVDFLGRTALLYAATGPFPETVRILLDRGADPDMVDSQEHFSPLMHAAAEGNLEVVKVLIDHGADWTLRDVDGDDAASFAALGGHARVTEYLNALGD